MGRWGDPLDRIMARVVHTDTGCWRAAFGLTDDGYSRLIIDGVRVLTHRYTYERLVGPIPQGLVIDHLCRVRNCVNPAHLEPVTVRENLLRGDTFQARNAAKTTCPAGHEYDRIEGKGGRSCKTCAREHTRRWRAKQKHSLTVDVTARAVPAA